jgi:hypothetical protein
MISKITIRAYDLSSAAVEVLEESGVSDAGVDADFCVVDVSDNGAALLRACLTEADDDRVQGWTEYVSSMVWAAQRALDEQAAADEANAEYARR